MTSQEACVAVMNWVTDTLPELQAAYAYIPLMTSTPLPDVVVDVELVQVSPSNEIFPEAAIQQAFVKMRSMGLSFLVNNDEPEGAASLLRDFEERLTASLLHDGTLAGRVPFVAPQFSFDFTPPFIERDDGTRGREMTMNMTVGELVEEAG